MFGSTPLARGTLGLIGHHLLLNRFNPARAGNSIRLRRCGIRRTVQPRSRGELIILGVTLCINLGSTPLARGTQILKPPRIGRARFNPARAGNSCKVQQNLLHLSVQPRSRGELAKRRKLRRLAQGSTPLARGTHLSMVSDI